MLTTYVQILRPDFPPSTNGRRIPTELSDYVMVPRLNTHGTWNIVDLLSFGSLAALSVMRDGMDRKGPVYYGGSIEQLTPTGKLHLNATYGKGKR